MAEFILSLLVFLAAVTGMSIGVLRGRRAIQGSCGGLGNIPGISPDCGGSCQRPCPRKRPPASRSAH
jgi:hypothetical protein